MGLTTGEIILMKLEKLQTLLEKFAEDYSHKIDDDVSLAVTVVINCIGELLEDDTDEDTDSGEDVVEAFQSLLGDDD